MTRNSLFLLGVLALLAPALSHAKPHTQTERFAREVEADLTGGILPFWLEHTVDPAGGFYGTVRNDGHAGAFAVPASCDKQDLNVAAFVNIARGESAVHIVNNAASCPAVVSGLPAGSTCAVVHVTNAASNSVAQCLPVRDGCVALDLLAESFISILVR